MSRMFGPSEDADYARSSAVEPVKLGISGINLTEVMGFGHQKEPAKFYDDTENPVSFVPKIRIEVVVPVGLADKTIDAIERSAHTGEIGDGKIFVTTIDHVMRIRTGEMDDAAL